MSGENTRLHLEIDGQVMSEVELVDWHGGIPMGSTMLPALGPLQGSDIAPPDPARNQTTGSGAATRTLWFLAARYRTPAGMLVETRGIFKRGELESTPEGWPVTYRVWERVL